MGHQKQVMGCVYPCHVPCFTHSPCSQAPLSSGQGAKGKEIFTGGGGAVYYKSRAVRHGGTSLKSQLLWRNMSSELQREFKASLNN